MMDRPPKKPPAGMSPKEARAARLAEELRANLKRRKDAGRSRNNGKDGPKNEQSSEER
jgi:hypothetical protein